METLKTHFTKNNIHYCYNATQGGSIKNKDNILMIK